MKPIEQNPFRMLGISVNASPKDLAANKGKMRLLDIGKELTFQLDLPGMLHPIVRTKESVAVAERDINLPHDRVRHALFWFAQPDSPLGKLAYDHLLQGLTDSAIEKFNRCPKWEAKLCLATLYLQRGNTLRALNAISFVIDKHCDEFVQTVAGQTHNEYADTLRHDYVMAIAQEVDIAAILAQTSDGDLPEAILAELRSVAVDKPMASIEKAIATAKSVDNKDAAAQLKAGRDLMNSTKAPCQQLARLDGKSDMRYSRLADKLANQILQCSINYFNNIEGENREIIENALALGEYALTVAVGKMARDHVQHNVDILRKKKADLPPYEVEEHDNAIKGAVVMSVISGRTIDDAIKLLRDCVPHIVAIKEATEQNANLSEYYTNISTQVVETALYSVIEEFNDISKSVSDDMDDVAKRSDARTRMENLLRKTWKAFLMMDLYDKSVEYKEDRYSQNKKTIREIIDNWGGKLENNRYSTRIVIDPYFNIFGSTRRHTFSIPDYLTGEDNIDLRTERELYNLCKREVDEHDDLYSLFSGGESKKSQCCLYIERYPQGKYIQEVEKILEDEIARTCHSVSSCNEYLEKYPNGRHAKSIRNKLKELKDDEAFRQCKSISDYLNYKVSYPKGRHYEEADKMITEIKDYERCSTIEECKHYIASYPSGRFTKEVNEKIDNLSFANCNKKSDYKKYLEDFPNGKHKKEAEVKIEEGCYIATMVYGDYNHPQVMVLRHFRDDVLQQHSWGRAFVKFYYRNSPGWVERLKDKKGANRFIRAILDQFIKVYNHE